MSDQVQREEQATSNTKTPPGQGESSGSTGTAMRTQLRAMDFSAGADMLRPRAPVQKKGPPKGPPAPEAPGTEEESEERQEEQRPPGGEGMGGGAGGDGGPEEGGPGGGPQDERDVEKKEEEQASGDQGEHVDVNAPVAEVSGALTTLAEDGANEAGHEAGGGGGEPEQMNDPGSQVAPLTAAPPVPEVGAVDVDANAGANETPAEEVAEGGDVQGGEVVVAPGGGGGGEVPVAEGGGGAHAAAGPAAQAIVPPAVSSGLFVPRTIPPLYAAMPNALGAHNVAGVIGNDPQTGAAIFTGSINQSVCEEQPEMEAVPVSQGAAQGVADQQAAESNAKLAEFLAAGTARVQRVQAEQQALAPQIEAERAALVANVEAAAASALANIEGAFSAALGLVDSEATAALADADASHDQTVAAIDAKLSAARATIDADNLAAITRLGEMRTSFATDVAGVFTAGSARFTAAGTTWGTTATTAAEARAAAYRAQPLPQRSGVREFFEGADYESNKRNARVSAAQQVGVAYREEYARKATEAASGLGGAAPSVVEGANAHINTVSDAIGSNKTNTLAALEQAATAAKQGAATARDSVKASIESAKNDNVTQLEAARQQANTAIETQRGQAVASIDESAETMRVGLEAGYTQVGQSLSDIVAQAEQAAGQAPPDPAELAVLLERSSVAMDAAEQGLRDTINAQRDAGFAHLREVGTTAATSLTEAGATAAQQAATVGQNFVTAMGTLKGELQRILGEQQTQFETGTDTAVTGHKTACDTAISNLEGELTNAKQNVQTNVDGYVTDLETDFGRTHAGMDATITSEAQKAADKVQPAWASVLTFVIKVIIAIAVAVAIAALCASGVGIGLVLLGGALIGAAGAVASYLVDCASGAAEFSWGQMGLEAVKGGIGGLITAATGGIGSAAAGSFLNQGAVAFLSSGVTNVAAQYAAKAGIGIAINMASGYLQQLGSNIFDSSVPWSQVFTNGQYDQFVGNLGPNIIGGIAGSYTFKNAGAATRIMGATGATAPVAEAVVNAGAGNILGAPLAEGTKQDMSVAGKSTRDNATTAARRDMGTTPNTGAPMTFDPT